MTEVEERLLSALKSAEAWLDRWAVHVGNCRGGIECTCGLTAIHYEAAITIQNVEYGDDRG